MGRTGFVLGCLGGIVVVMIAGCSASKDSAQNAAEDTVSVGMPIQEARKKLKESGAKNVVMAIVDSQTGEVAPDVYELSSGEVVVLKSEGEIVSELSLCRNPDRGKANRVWEDVSEVSLEE